MSLKFARIASLLVVAAAAGGSLWARPLLPDAPIATHFDLSGQVNGTMPRDVALIFGPAAALVIAMLMLWVIPLIMPKKATLERSSEAYGASVVMVVLLFGLVHGGLIAHALHYPFDLMKMILAGTGLLFIVIGNYLPKTRYNYVMGLRDPWTLSSEEVWDKVHRLAGPLYMLLGIGIVADAFLLPLPLAFMVMLAAVAAVIVVCLIYSYLTAKKLNVA